MHRKSAAMRRLENAGDSGVMRRRFFPYKRKVRCAGSRAAACRHAGYINHARVRRERPAAVAWALALAVAMLMVYLLTMGAQPRDSAQIASASPRITREVAFEKMILYAVSLCACDSQEAARISAASFTARGAAGAIYKEEKKWHVLGAVYETDKDARRIAERLNKDMEIEASVLKLWADDVGMRVTAPESHVNAIITAESILRNQTLQLGDIALQIDRGEMQPAGAQTICAAAATEAQAASAFFAGIPETMENELCAALAERLNRLSAMLFQIADIKNMTSTDLSGMIRCAQIENFIGQIEIRNELMVREKQ